MHPLDEEKTTFIIEDANYCYKVMPFSLNNASATYQRLMDRVFKDQIRRNIEVYVDNIVVKSQSVDLEEVFAQVSKYDIWLNLEKCTFGVERGKFMGLLIT